ncbi:cation-translocating P-type ATPase [Phenylobacterium kunshanense]|uniref:Cation-translocating P-type ATPase n=1 Tax=Phenylobacterium kunshanense TaxID=1445034 RepID=A0A328B7I2_9CAUL|nr:HAD-IC family P-type ATPase [Phenylobacterium kunshanense]RAK62809.1 cation-translocating P-type ATPase [Phenylobacterium kunshanense]
MSDPPPESAYSDHGLNGLSEAEAARRLACDGPNQLSESRRRRLPQIIREVLREPMFLLLLVAVGFYFFLGDTAEAAFLFAGAVATIGLVIVQEARSERALAALKALAEPTARVIRGGAERRVPAAELVRGDIVLLAEGGRAPADAALVAGDVLSVDESVLTGESAPVVRSPLAPGEISDQGEAPEQARICAGTLLVRGHGVGLVTATGRNTRIGGIGAALATAAEPPTPLQQATRRLVGILGVAAFGLAIAVLLAHGFIRGGWIEGGLAALTIGIALVPEEFPMVLAVFLALGGWRLAQKKVLVRRTAAIEALGAISVLCVDKTGTLTRNEMSVAALWAAGQEVGVGDSTGAAVLRAAADASAVHPLDPMDRALRAAAPDASVGEAPLRSYPLRPDRLAFIQAWPEARDGVRYAAKGAPEAIFDLCRLEPAARNEVHAAVAAFARRGLRVLGVATATDVRDQGGDPGDATFGFDGLVAFEDPVRADVPPALAAAREAGISVAMITGDFPDTALAIAAQAGVDASGGALTGAELRAMSDGELREAVRRVRVFARIDPEQKLRLVQALQANGERVGMFGDGVNDAPALEAAHVGVAMGQRGVDVAREASDLILLDDRFASVVSGIAEGRRIYGNLRAALAYIVTVHIPMAGLALLPPLIGAPPVLFPLQVVLLELVIDPMCALVFEGRRASHGSMQRPPRPGDEPLMGVTRLLTTIGQGVALLAGVFGMYLWLLDQGQPPEAARAAALVALVAANLGVAGVLAAAGRAVPRRQFLAFGAILAGAVGCLAAALLIPGLAILFAFAAPAPALLAEVAALGALGGVAVGFAGRLVRLRSAT